MTVRAQPTLTSGRTKGRLHRDVLAAMNQALAVANPMSILSSHLKLHGDTLCVEGLTYHLGQYSRIFVIGAGKASGYMGEGIERILGNRITGGLVVVPDHLRPFPHGRRIKYHRGSHPIPSKKNLLGVFEMLRLVENVRPDDLIIVLLSGGASALMESPLGQITLGEARTVTSILLGSGADIHQINIVRRHVSRIAGGRLAETLKGSTVLTLIVSDVVGDNLEAIGSGPTAADPSTYHDARQVLEKYNVWKRIPPSVRNLVLAGEDGKVPETLKEGDEAFHSVRNLIIGRNRESCIAASSYLRRVGYHAETLSTGIVGEAREVGLILGSILMDIRENGIPFSPPAALVCGGETTVTVKGRGKGGRNQELALAAAIRMSGSTGLVLGTLATDGIDGPTSAAGAVVDGTTVTRGLQRGMVAEDYLANNNSYQYFSRLGDTVRTGPTGTNINDLIVMAASKQ